MALSNEQDIRTARVLCKRLTGRTNSKPLGEINRVLRDFSSEFVVKATRVQRALLPTHRGVLDLAVFRTTGNTTAAMRTQSLNFPFSYQEFIKSVGELDAHAEASLGLTYGRRGQGAVAARG